MLRLTKLTCFLALFVTQSMAQDLKQTYQQVLASDPRLLIDSLGVQIGVAREKQSFGALLPQVTVGGNATSNTRRSETRPIDHYSGQRYSFSIQQTLFDMQKFRAWQRSKIVLGQYELQLKDTEAAVRLDTIMRYFALLEAKDTLALICEEKRAVEEKNKQIEALYQRQLVKVTEFYEIKARLDMLVAEEVDATQQVALAEEGLRELTQKPLNDVVTLNQHVRLPEQNKQVDEYVSELVNKSPALMSIRASVKAAKMNLNQQRGGHYPVVALQISKQQSDIGFDNSSTGITDTEVLGLTFSLPLFTGGSASGKVDEARHQLAISKASYDQEYRKAVKGLKDELLQVKTLTRRIAATRKAVESAQKSYQAEEESFKLLISTQSDVLDAQQMYLQAKRGFQQALYDYVMSWAKLEYRLGSLNDQSIEQINEWLKS